MPAQIGGGAYKARRFVAPFMARPPQNFCHQMLLDPKIVVLDAFCGIKNTQKSILAARTPLGKLTPLSHTLQLVGRETSCPLPKNPTPASAFWASNFGPSGLAAPCLLTFDYLPPLPPVHRSKAKSASVKR